MVDITLIELGIIAAVDVAISISIQRKISSVEKTYHLQNKVKKQMDDLKKLLDSKASKEQIAAAQNEMNKTLSQQTMHQMRSTPILLVISVLVYFLILPRLFPGAPATVNLLVTTINYTGFQDNTYFIVFTIVISLATQLILSKMDKKRLDAKYKGLENLEKKATDAVESNGK